MASRLERLYEALEKSALTLEALSPRILKLRHREEQLLAAREETASLLERRKAELPTSEEIKVYVADFRSLLLEGTFPECKALVRNFVKGIDVDRDEAQLTYTIPMPSDGVRSEAASVLDFVQCQGRREIRPCGGAKVSHWHDEKEPSWEPVGVRPGAGVPSSGVSQESSGSSEIWEAVFSRLCRRR